MDAGTIIGTLLAALLGVVAAYHFLRRPPAAELDTSKPSMSSPSDSAEDAVKLEAALIRAQHVVELLSTGLGSEPRLGEARHRSNLRHVSPGTRRYKPST